jgi:serine protease AprX
MNPIRRSRFITWGIIASMVLSLNFGILITEKANAQSPAATRDKLAPDLRAKVTRAQSGADQVVRVIIEFSGPLSGPLNALLNSNGVHIRRKFQNFKFYVVELPASVAAQLSSFAEVRSVSLDAKTHSSGHISATTGADVVRTTSGINVTGLDGTGIGIAFLDSGMDSAHVSLLNKGTSSRVVVSKDFTGENRTDDPYGHGTHVTSTAAGNGRISNAAYLGIAPNANIINLRVLNSQGSGSVSNLLAAADWIISNRTTYNIRVVNMSLGTPAVQSYQYDPACLAVRSMVDAGIVVAVAAGNNGKDNLGRKIYGAISSPGNEPSAITVGASNSYGTNSRADDTVTTYSSRGPTRSYWKDTLGVNHYDNLIKPDLVAPGNKLVFAEADANLLVSQYPQLDAGVSPVDSRKMMRLNGTSMSSPVVAGAAALLLQANPNLTPNLVKAILSYTAQPLAGASQYEQGAGEVNIEGAVRLARLVRTDLLSTTLLGAPLLTSLTPPNPQSTIAGYTFNWSGKVNLGHAFASGTNLITEYQKFYALDVNLLDGVIVTDDIITLDGVIITDGVVASDGVVVADDIITLDGVIITDGVVITDNTLILDGVIITDGVVICDLTLQAQSGTLDGDDTDCMGVEVDTGVDCLDYDGVIITN